MEFNYYPPCIDRALRDIARLQDLARKIKDPPGFNQKENRPKQERPPFQEASKDFNFDCKPQINQSQRVFQTTPESDIIKFISKTSSLSFSVRSLEALSIQFGISEFRLRQLISSVINNKMRG